MSDFDNLDHALSTLDFAAQMLTQMTHSAAPRPMIEQGIQPFSGWIAQTRDWLEKTDIDPESVEVLETGLWALGDLADSFTTKFAANEEHYPLFVIADAMQQTTREMLEELEDAPP